MCLPTSNKADLQHHKGMPDKNTYRQRMCKSTARVLSMPLVRRKSRASSDVSLRIQADQSRRKNCRNKTRVPRLFNLSIAQKRCHHRRHTSRVLLKSLHNHARNQAGLNLRQQVEQSTKNRPRSSGAASDPPLKMSYHLLLPRSLSRRR